MPVAEIQTNSDNALDKVTSAMVILPDSRHPGPFPVLYLLHGLAGNHASWVRNSSLERYVADLPLIVVMPDGGRSFYTDALANPRSAFETYLVRDLIGFVDRLFRTLPGRAGRVIAGFSMGGYGALKLALKHPDLFCAAASHSGAVDFASDAPWPDDAVRREFEPIFGPRARGGPEDLFAIATRADRATLPALRIDCGVDDVLIAPNRRFHQHLDTLGVPHAYAEYPGAHDWAYWDLHVQETIAFVARELGLQRAAAAQ